MKFRCWVPEEGYTRDDADARDVEATDAAEAAEAFAETWYEAGDHFPQLDVSVVLDDGPEQKFRVVVDFDPMFTASEIP